MLKGDLFIKQPVHPLYRMSFAPFSYTLFNPFLIATLCAGVVISYIVSFPVLVVSQRAAKSRKQLTADY